MAQSTAATSLPFARMAVGEPFLPACVPARTSPTSTVLCLCRGDDGGGEEAAGSGWALPRRGVCERFPARLACDATAAPGRRGCAGSRHRRCCRRWRYGLRSGTGGGGGGERCASCWRGAKSKGAAALCFGQRGDRCRRAAAAVRPKAAGIERGQALTLWSCDSQGTVPAFLEAAGGDDQGGARRRRPRAHRMALFPQRSLHQASPC